MRPTSYPADPRLNLHDRLETEDARARRQDDDEDQRDDLCDDVVRDVIPAAWEAEAGESLEKNTKMT